MAKQTKKQQALAAKLGDALLAKNLESATADDVTRTGEFVGNVYYLAKFAGIFGLDGQDIGAQQTGMSKEAFKAKLLEAGR